MKKFSLFLALLLLCLSFTSCDNHSKKMKGFTYEELAEYLSSVDGLTPMNWRDDPIILPCKDNILSFKMHTNYLRTGRDYMGILLQEFFQVEAPSPVPYLYPTVNISIYDETRFTGQEYYITQKAPENFAYILRDFNVKCSPEWTEWIDYNIPAITESRATHGLFDAYWYNPLIGQFESSAYYRQLEDSTELYVVFQEMSLFYSELYHIPFLMSEELFETLKAEFDFEPFMKRTVEDFSNWFMSEHLEEIPPVFADIKDEYVYCVTRELYSDEFKESEYNDPSLFYEDLKNLGVNFDALKTYVIKATFPHGGTIEDIFWELIG